MPSTMRAIEISKPGGPEVLTLVERPVPVPGVGQILIRMEAAGVNRPDALQRAGAYAPPAGASDLPGLEGAGTVTAVGSGVTRWAVGDAVCALLPGGGYAEFCLCDQDHALRLPQGFDMIRAAAICETYFTVWSNVFMRSGLLAGESFLVHGGSSGIGTMAIQLARAMGARVFTTAGSSEKCAVCERLGAEIAVNYREQDFVESVREATAGRGVDVILDMVGGDYIPRNIKALADDGRLVMIAFLGGVKAEVNFAQVMVRRLSITGSTLRPQSDLAKAAIAEQLRAKVWPLLDAGVIAPVMDSTFDLAQAPEAHRRLESAAHVGKVVLKVV
ncbi:MAG: NAD(P)H-quinone oxidoreductase [Alphaproteobacteria bacterium]|nr:NAD(P)H-quinone oxidoreductase [Alphaproteobacteria bacterium]